MKVIIVVYHPFELWSAPDWVLERLKRDFPNIVFVRRNDYDHIEDDLRDTDVAITWSLRPEQFKAAKKLRWIHSPAAAVHQLMIPEIINSDVVVTNARDVHGPVVAEHAIALLMALAKRLPSAVRYQSRKIWAQRQLWEERPRPREVTGATLGLVGVGSIGREVARVGAALGMRIIAVREHPEKGIDWTSDAEDHAVYGADRLEEMLAVADYIVIAAPLTSKTQHLLDRERLAKIKPDAYLINVARGALVDEAALVEALRSGKFAGAALDVTQREPLPADSPLWELENVLITPHTAGVTEKLWERHYAQIRDNLRRFQAGQPLLGMVDKQKGY